MGKKSLGALSDAQLQSRLAEIDAELQSLPAATGPMRASLGAKKWKLYGKKRRIVIEIANRKGSISTTDRRALYKNPVCAICGSREKPTLDHIIPASRGGSGARSNLRILCVSCNSRKGARHA